MPAYPATLTSLEHGGVLLRFPDVPEAVACGTSEREALANARPVLEAVLQSYVDEGRSLPTPSRLEGAALVETNAFDRDRLRPLAYAGRM